VDADWTFERTDDGSPTLRHTGHGEACHSTSGAWLEARERYAASCCLRERALGDPTVLERGALRLLDVGTGLGLNLAAALEALEGTGIELDAVSLEVDPSVIARTLTLDTVEGPADLQRWHASVKGALQATMHGAEPEPLPVPLEVDGNTAGQLELVLGDGRETLPGLGPRSFDAVFLDAFSPRVDPALWGAGFLNEIARRMAPGSWLSTYTVSLAVRARLAAAGLRVGPGARVGAKRSGTLASPDLDPGEFDARTERRLARRLAERARAARVPEPNFPPRAGGAGPSMA
jgi:chorismate dehydratase